LVEYCKEREGNCGLCFASRKKLYSKAASSCCKP
jgi:hypothetical protein